MFLYGNHKSIFEIEFLHVSHLPFQKFDIEFLHVLHLPFQKFDIEFSICYIWMSCFIKVIKWQIVHLKGLFPPLLNLSVKQIAHLNVLFYKSWMANFTFKNLTVASGLHPLQIKIWLKSRSQKNPIVQNVSCFFTSRHDRYLIEMKEWMK